jgi:hypothetical protein
MPTDSSPDRRATIAAEIVGTLDKIRERPADDLHWLALAPWLWNNGRVDEVDRAPASTARQVAFSKKFHLCNLWSRRRGLRPCNGGSDRFAY